MSQTTMMQEYEKKVATKGMIRPSRRGNYYTRKSKCWNTERERSSFVVGITAVAYREGIEIQQEKTTLNNDALVHQAKLYAIQRLVSWIGENSS